MIAVTLKTIKAAILVLGIKILEIPAHRMFVSSPAQREFVSAFRELGSQI